VTGHAVCSVSRWSVILRDQVAALRVLKLLPGFGPAAARRAYGLLGGERRGFSGLEAFKAPAAAAESWALFVPLMNDLARASEWKADVGRIRCWYDPLLVLLYDSAQTRLADLDQLERIAAQHPSRASF